MSRVGESLDRTFSSLHQRNFRLYVTGQLVSASGTWINATATAWLVLELSRSGIALGLNTALLFAPILLIGPVGGVLADRFDKRKILLATQSCFAAISFCLWALISSGRVELWMVYALSLLNGVVTAVDNPTRQSFYVEMVGSGHVTNAVSLNSAAFTGAKSVGPALAALLIGTMGLASCFLVDGLSYLAVIGALVAMHVEEMHPQARSKRRSGHLVAGLRYVWKTDELRRPLLIMVVVFAISLNFSVLLPLLARRTFAGDVGSFGALSALAGFGSFLGAIVLANRGAKPTVRRLGIFAFATGAALMVAGAAPTLQLALVAMVPLGFSVMAFVITGNTILQVNARPQARGRVMALYGVVFLGSTPIGSPLAGWIGQHLGPRAGLLVAGAAAVSVGLVTLLKWRNEKAAAEAAADDVVEAGAVPASAPA
jgi:MFS family permease